MKKSKFRLIMLGAAVWMVFILFVFRLIQVQIVDGKSYLEKQQRMREGRERDGR